jgi:hypothetical protein
MMRKGQAEPIERCADIVRPPIVTGVVALVPLMNADPGFVPWMRHRRRI